MQCKDKIYNAVISICVAITWKNKFCQEQSGKVKLEGGSRPNILYKMNDFGITIHATDI